MRWARAFSSEVDTGSREENASEQESRAPFRFHRNGNSSRAVANCPRRARRFPRECPGCWTVRAAWCRRTTEPIVVPRCLFLRA
ncbi:hypothetical protein XH93_30945 [Bradyrhizobium sp. CCBAU 51753]|nr:hypothetical protein XH93_30945 [Bradyrhizobium sp. CCBAU 51753]